MEESSWLSSLLFNPFTTGLAVGLVVALIVWARGWMKARELNQSLRKLREHLHTKLEIDASETERRKHELDNIRQERDNLRNMVQVLNQKPGKPELRQMQVYQRAVEIMFEKSPGFAPAWQITLKEAEEDIRQAERGIVPFFKRIAGSSSGPASERSGKRPLELEQNSSK